MNREKQQHIVQPFNVGFDLDQAMDGFRQISVEGIPHTDKRKEKIEQAIRVIQNDPEGAFSEEYIGFKNYASFGDQAVRCRYGMGPKHGSVVFRIGRQTGYEGKIGDEAIYLLQCVRDFVGVEFDERQGRVRLNFCDVLRKINRLQNEYDLIYSFVKDFQPDLVENQEEEVVQ